MQIIKRYVTLLLVVALTVLPLFACVRNGADESGQDADNRIKITVGETELSASLNSDEISKAMVFDRRYVTDSVTLSELHANRDVYLVEAATLSGETVYTVSGNSTDREYNTVPVNGFLLSLEKGTIEAKNGTRVSVTDYELPETESLKYCVMRVSGQTRRVYLRDPETVGNEEIITFLTELTDKDTAIPDSCAAYALVKSSNTVFSVGEKLTGAVPGGTYAVIFGGAYNMAFAERYMKGGEVVNMTRLSVVYSDTYKSSLEIGGERVELAAKVNGTPGADGIYIYDSSYSELTTPEFSGSSAAVVVSDGKAVFLAGEGNRAIIPTGAAYVVVFAGKSMKYYNSLTPGDEIEAVLAEISNAKPADGVAIEYSLSSVAFTQYNGTRYTDYLNIYNQTGKTGTNVYGFEIAVNSEGKMCAESHYGNMTVPDGGYVLSGHGTSQDALEKMYVYGAQVQIDDRTKTVYVMTTPLTRAETVRSEYETLKSRYDALLGRYEDFEYEAADEKLTKAGEKLASLNALIDGGNYADAINSLTEINTLLDESRLLVLTQRAAENRAAWYAPTETSDADVEKTIALMKKMNLNTLYIETWRNGETIFPTSLEWTRETPSFNGFDVLGAFVRIGHENGIEIHCWVHNFFIGTTSALSDANHIVSKTKQYHLITRTGTPYNPTPEYGNFVFLDPYTRECRDFVLAVYKEIIDNYDVDGIHLDYTRFPEPNDYSDSKRDDFGYNDDIVKAFMEAQNTSVNPHDIYPGHSLWGAWCKFRENIINSFVDEVYTLVKAKDPDIHVSCAVFPNLDTAPTTIFQNVKAWLDADRMDEVFAMAYSSSVDYIIDNTKDFMEVVDGKSFYSVGLGAFQSYGEYIYLLQVDATRSLGVDGTAVFSLASVNGNVLCGYLGESVHKKPAVTTYSLEKTLSAQMTSLSERCEGIYTLSGADKAELDALKKAFEEIKTFCGTFESDGATAEQRLAFIADARQKLAAVIIPATGKDGFDKAVESAIDECIRCLERSEHRIRVNYGIAK